MYLLRAHLLLGRWHTLFYVVRLHFLDDLYELLSLLICSCVIIIIIRVFFSLCNSCPLSLLLSCKFILKLQICFRKHCRPSLFTRYYGWDARESETNDGVWAWFKWKGSGQRPRHVVAKWIAALMVRLNQGLVRFRDMTAKWACLGDASRNDVLEMKGGSREWPY